MKAVSMSLQFHNPFPYTQFERDAASVIAVTPSLLRFTLCFFASVPLGAGLSLLKNPAGECGFICVGQKSLL